MADEKEIYYDNEIDHVVIVSGKYVDKIKLDTEPKYSNYTKIEEELIQKVSALYGSPVAPSKGGTKHIELKSENGDELYVLEWHYEKQNIVKRVCKELGITQRELAERIGMSADSLRTLSAKGQISTQTEAAINLVLENENLKKELENYKALRTAIKTMID
ncbi:helix-turn-helix domain-containing protein [Campylobacter concisus]|uniref:helix-turn-helix domain-containing protein n=1 Tax=Campylobacter concisus TaxID=199 RepID=UPI001F1D22A8|nr:helix-turn-helix transcriptional regulator [Campylobacter concisus]